MKTNGLAPSDGIVDVTAHREDFARANGQKVTVMVKVGQWSRLRRLKDDVRGISIGSLH
jgi:hypothetical protein